MARCSRNCDSDYTPRISSIPGPRGPAGDAGEAGTPATAGKNAFTSTTSPFVMPEAGNEVTVTVVDSSWMAVGLPVFIETAGFFVVRTILSSTSISVEAYDVPTNTAAATVIETDQHVAPSGLAYIDASALAGLDSRLTVLENTPGGVRSFRSTEEPDGPFNEGDLWFRTNLAGETDGRFRWDGSGWVALDDAGVDGLVADVAALETGLNELTTNVNALNQEYVLAVVGSGDETRVAGFRVTVPGGGDEPTEFVVQADKFAIIGSDGTGKKSPFYIEDGVTYIDEAVIPELSAEKIAVNGDFQTVNLGVLGRLFHPSVAGTPKRYFRAMDFGTSFESDKVFSAGNCLTAGYGHATPVYAYAPGHAGWTSTGVTACPDSDGKVRVQVQCRLIGYTGAILTYAQINDDTPFALAAVSSDDGGNAYVDCTRILTGVAIDDVVKIYVAPADADGVVVPDTCRYEIDATFFNW